MLKITNECNLELMKRYPDKYFDLAIVDPPYGINAPKQGATPNQRKQFRKDCINSSMGQITAIKDYQYYLSL